MPATPTDRLQGILTSTAVKPPCRLKTTANHSLSGLAAIDGVTPAEGDRILVGSNTDAVENGIWNAASGDWTRAKDFDGTRDAVGGTQVLVISGSANANTYWRVAGEGPVDIGTDEIEFEAAVINDSATLAFLQAGTGAVSRTVQDKLRETSVSITDFGAVSSETDDNTAAFTAAIASLGANGGVIDVPMGAWRVNLVIDHDNITLRGQGGTAENDAYPPCLRPYATGAGTTTLKFGNQTGLRFRNKLENILISGDDGFGNMADKALWLAGGTIFFAATNVDIRDGLHSLHIEPGGTWPTSGLKLDRVFIRNSVNNSASRAIYVRRYADATGYVTDLNIVASKVNTTGQGYWLEVDGTGSTGLVVHFLQTYVDHNAGWGILTSASGLEVIECFGGLQLDPGAPAPTVIMKRRDLVKDPSRYIRGFVEGVGGHNIEFSDASTLTLSSEPGIISYQARLQTPFLGDTGYFASAASPYRVTIGWDFQSETGPLRWNGCTHRWTDATDATSATTGAIGTTGGISAAKAIWAGTKLVYTTTVNRGATVILGAQGSALPADATDLASAITLLNAIKAGISTAGAGSTHGLFP